MRSASEVSRRHRLAPALALGLAILPGTARAAGTLTLSESFDYSLGHYGEPQATEIFYDGLSARYELDLTTFRLTIPYIKVIGPTNVVPDLGSLATSGRSSRVSRSGLGDIIAGASQGFTPSFLPNTQIDVGGKIKFGTASAAQDLGTGFNDYFLELDLTHDFGEGWSGFGGIGRRFAGEPASFGLRDVWYGSLGAAWSFDSERSIALSLEGREALAPPTIGNDLQLTASFSQKFWTDWKVTFYGAAGFTTDTPGFECGFVFSRRFSL